MNRLTYVPADPGRPHRCPCCRAGVALGRVRPWTVGRCSECGLRWFLNVRAHRSTRYLDVRCLRSGSHRVEVVQAQLIHAVTEIVRRYRDDAHGGTRQVLDRLLKELEARWTLTRR